MPHGGVGLWVAGPAVLVVLLAVLACLTLIAAGAARLERLVSVAERAGGRLERHRALPMLWGLSAAVFVFAGGTLLVRSHVLALAGFALLLAGLGLLSLGLAVTASGVGAALAAAVKAEDSSLASLRRGLAVLLLASCLPYLGWLVSVLALAAGTGAVLEALLARD